MLTVIYSSPEAEWEASNLFRIDWMMQAEAARVFGVSSVTVNRGVRWLALTIGNPYSGVEEGVASWLGLVK